MAELDYARPWDVAYPERLAGVVAKLDPGVRVHAHGVPDRLVEHAPRKVQLAQLGLDAAGIAARVRALHGTEALAG